MPEPTPENITAPIKARTRDSSPTRKIGAVVFELTDGPGAVQSIVGAIQGRAERVFAFCNVHTFNIARENAALADALSRSTVFNDGIGIDVASRILYGEPFPANLNGTDLTPAVLAALPQPTSVFLLGSPPGVAERAKEALERQFPNIVVVGTHHGFFGATEGVQLVEKIRAAGTELLLLAMGNPRQEVWADEIRSQTGAVIMCVGAYLDFASGRVSRAPQFVRTLRLEWAYRLANEPVRLFRRYMGGAVPFLNAVLRERYAVRKGP